MQERAFTKAERDRAVKQREDLGAAAAPIAAEAVPQLDMGDPEAAPPATRYRVAGKMLDTSAEADAAVKTANGAPAVAMRQAPMEAPSKCTSPVACGNVPAMPAVPGTTQLVITIAGGILFAGAVWGTIQTQQATQSEISQQQAAELRAVEERGKERVDMLRGDVQRLEAKIDQLLTRREK
mgnify:CR=1 FL=1